MRADDETWAIPHGNLGRLVDRFWAPHTTNGRLVVTSGALPVGYIAAEQYVVVPSIARARFLVPLQAPRAVAAAFGPYLSTISAGSRLQGRAIASAFRTRAGELLLRDRLTVALDARIPREEWRRHLVISEFADRLDAPGLVGVHPVRRLTPNAKPTVRLFDPNGTPRGYAKLGWSPPTARLVRNERESLDALGGEVAGLTVPRSLAAGVWSDPTRSLEYLVTSPLPPRLRAWRTLPEDDPTILTRIAATGRCHRAPLAGSDYAESLRSRLGRARAAMPEEADVLGRWLSRLEQDPTPVGYGRWHGDWVPWNLARTSLGGAVWDWEYSAAEVPVGFDLLHWHFQTSLADPAGTLDQASADVRSRLAGLSALGVAPSQHKLVADLYLLEMLTRATGLAAEGSGWNPKLHPRLISFASEAAALPS